MTKPDLLRRLLFLPPDLYPDPKEGEDSGVGLSFESPTYSPDAHRSPQPGPSKQVPSNLLGVSSSSGSDLRLAAIEEPIYNIVKERIQRALNNPDINTDPVSSEPEFLVIDLDDPHQFPPEVEILEYLQNRGLPFSGRFPMPLDWTIFRDIDNQPILDIPCSGRIKPPMFKIGVEKKARG